MVHCAFANLAWFILELIFLQYIFIIVAQYSVLPLFRFFFLAFEVQMICFYRIRICFVSLYSNNEYAFASDILIIIQ